MTLTATINTGAGSDAAQKTADDIERRINDALHQAINESSRRHGIDPRIEIFTPAAKHIRAHAQRLTTITIAVQILEIMVVVSEDARGEYQGEVTVFRRFFLDPSDAPPVEIIECGSPTALRGVENSLIRYVDAFFSGIRGNRYRADDDINGVASGHSVKEHETIY